MEEKKDVKTEELENYIAKWRQDRIDEINRFVGLPVSHTDVLVPIVKGLVSDVGMMIQWIEVLTYKIKKLEEK